MPTFPYFSVSDEIRHLHGFQIGTVGFKSHPYFFKLLTSQIMNIDLT